MIAREDVQLAQTAMRKVPGWDLSDTAF